VVSALFARNSHDQYATAHTPSIILKTKSHGQSATLHTTAAAQKQLEDDTAAADAAAAAIGKSKEKVALGSDGWKERYYRLKFDAGRCNHARFRQSFHLLDICCQILTHSLFLPSYQT
jgi:hypothetical protein